MDRSMRNSRDSAGMTLPPLSVALMVMRYRPSRLGALGSVAASLVQFFTASSPGARSKAVSTGVQTLPFHLSMVLVRVCTPLVSLATPMILRFAGSWNRELLFSVWVVRLFHSIVGGAVSLKKFHSTVLTRPASSVAVIVNRWAPSNRGSNTVCETWWLQGKFVVPEGTGMFVVWLPSRIRARPERFASFASPARVNAGLLPPPNTLLSAGEEMTISGSTVSILKPIHVGVEAFPSTSLARICTRWGPSDKGGEILDRRRAQEGFFPGFVMSATAPVAVSQLLASSNR